MLKKILYSLWLVIFILFAIYFVKTSDTDNFLNFIENRTFDLRQNIIVNSGFKKPNKDIIIVAIDDASYEYVIDKYGEWPMPRDVYASLVDRIEKYQPKCIAFDLMFVKSLKSTNDADSILASVFKKYDNLFTAMNLDNQPEDVRVPIVLPDKLSIKVNNEANDVNFDTLTFTNCRSILNEIIESTKNIGIINVSRAEDGVIRKMPIVLKYQDRYYPQLAFKVALSLIGDTSNEFVINKKSQFVAADRKIYLDRDGSAILNWYGGAGTYEQIPLYALLENKDNIFSRETFNNKIVYFGTTASSLFDIKTTPTSKIYPGVEIQATYINNFIDNNFITKADKTVTNCISVLLAFVTGLIVLLLTSTGIISLSVVSLYSAYVIIAYFLLKYCNIWIEIVYPIVFGIIVFIAAFIVKYIIKSRDFDQQYKLATTDGLTDLYNHRYFQEQMKMQVEQSKRYGNEFSLIILDIDYFKKFNDTFGHQAGDAVLRQVAQLLKSNVRATDIVCRYGGEEISIILPNTNREVAFSTADKICKRIAEKKFKLVNNQESNVTVSIGVAAYPQDGDSASQIIEVADKRLYQAKNNGRNQVN